MKRFRVFWNEHNLHVFELEANSPEEAHEKFWDYLVSGKLTNSKPEDGIVDVDDVEEVI